MSNIYFCVDCKNCKVSRYTTEKRKRCFCNKTPWEIKPELHFRKKEACKDFIHMGFYNCFGEVVSE